MTFREWLVKLPTELQCLYRVRYAAHLQRAARKSAGWDGLVESSAVSIVSNHVPRPILNLSPLERPTATKNLVPVARLTASLLCFIPLTSHTALSAVERIMCSTLKRLSWFRTHCQRHERGRQQRAAALIDEWFIPLSGQLEVADVHAVAVEQGDCSTEVSSGAKREHALNKGIAGK